MLIHVVFAALFVLSLAVFPEGGLDELQAAVFAGAFVVAVVFAGWLVAGSAVAKWRRSRPQKYDHGSVEGRKARRNVKTGHVQFVLWQAGEQGHQVDCWHDFDSSWWGLFVKDGVQEQRPGVASIS